MSDTMNAAAIRLATLSRELGLVCSPDGRVAWADARATEQLGIRPGASLRELAPAEARDRVDALLRQAATTRVDDFALTLTVAGSATPLVVSAAPDGDGKILVVARVETAEVAELRQETRRQRHELMRREQQLNQIALELQESNRGVIALYAELDEKADSLRRTSEVKSRVVSNVSHEFRTPLNSILGLTRLLLARTDGPLTPEQEKQLGFILRSATELSELINDLLDLSKMEAGKIRLHATKFAVSDLFAALRGMSRPLQSRPEVELIFDDTADLPLCDTDDGKISQILRNLISNALKFTEKGEVRVSAWRRDDAHVVFSVADTGVGIAPADHDRVFEEFTQIENPLQKSVKGTGLGLSLSRKLAELLGGELTVASELGKGATFALTIPIVHPEVNEMTRLEARAHEADGSRSPVLVVEDDRQTLFLYEKYLSGSGFQVMPARTIEDARDILTRLRPAAIVLDVMLEGETSWSFLSELKTSTVTRDIPILVVTVTDRENKARALGADEFWMKPMDKDWLSRKLATLAKRGPVEKVLVIDDDEVSRYLVRRLLADTPYRITEATGGLEGIRLARQLLPNVILLDFVMPGMTAFEVLDELKADPDTRNIPVIIHTSKDLAEEERQRLKVATAAILSKQSLSRELAIARIREALENAGVRGEGDHAR